MLAGVLVAYGAFAVLAALVGAAATAIGLNNDLNRNDWARLGTGGAIAAAVILLLAYLFGGYVAGRMARRAGLPNGLAVFLLAIVLIAAVSAIIASQVDADTIRTNLRSLGIPTLGSEWSDIGTLATTTMPTPSPHPGPTSGIRLARTAPSTTARTAAEQAVSTRRSGAPSCAHE